MARRRARSPWPTMPAMPSIPMTVPGENGPAYGGNDPGNVRAQCEAVLQAPLGSKLPLTNPATGETRIVKVTNGRKKKAIQWLQESPAPAGPSVSGVAGMGFSGGLIDNLRF